MSERLAAVVDKSASFVALSNKTVRATETATATLRRLHTQRERILACSRRCDDSRALMSCSSQVSAARSSGDNGTAVQLLNRAIAIAREGGTGGVGGGATVDELQRELLSVADDVEAAARAAAAAASHDDTGLEQLLRILCSCHCNTRAADCLLNAISSRVAFKSSAALAQLQSVSPLATLLFFCFPLTNHETGAGAEASLCGGGWRCSCTRSSRR
jgi:hypothetical protein